MEIRWKDFHHKSFFPSGSSEHITYSPKLDLEYFSFMLVLNMWNIYKIDKQLILYRTDCIGSGTTWKRPLVSRIGNLFQKQLLVAFHLITYIIFILSLSSVPPSFSLGLSLFPMSFFHPCFTSCSISNFLFLLSLWLGFPGTASSNHRVQSTPPGTFQPTSRIVMEANCKSRGTQVCGDSE